ncbi:cupin domain-containing protein [Winogradskyella sp. 3972H.M.0a.05]|uniref:cupin domain-containing protein n=1 Tax=Winogradskyella sp. 3972H.M.0a.05 TaxID=2950277 RepID=UPI00339B068C
MTLKKIEQIIKKLNLSPHPEGGYFKETYRSSGTINENSLSENYKGNRSYSTCIYFLLTSDTFSAFHKINQDEIWHFYDGAPITLHIISEEGVHSKHIIGKDLENGEVPQLVVPGNHWFAANIELPDSYALVGCTVSPGFSFEDFQLPKRAELIAKFPQHSDVITKLSNP